MPTVYLRRVPDSCASKSFLLIFAFWLFAFLLHGQAGDTLIVLQNFIVSSEESITGRTYAWVDTMGGYSTKDVLQNDQLAFELLNEDDSIKVRFTEPSTLWLKFYVKHEVTEPLKSDTTIYLHIGKWSQTEIYVREARTLAIPTPLKGGILVSKRASANSANRHFIPFTIEPDKTYEVWVKISSVAGGGPLWRVDLLGSLWVKGSSFSLYYKNRFEYDYLKYTIGILFFFFLLNIIQYLISKDSVYAFYGLHLLANALYFQYFFENTFYFGTGIYFQWLSVLPYYLVDVILLLSYPFYYLFIQKYLDLKNRFPKINQRFNSVVKLLWLFPLILIAAEIFVPSTNTVFTLKIVLLILEIIIGAYALFIVFKIKDTLSRIILIGSLFFFGGSILGFIAIMFLNFGNGHYFTQAGILMEVCFFTIGLAYRSKKLEESKKEAVELQLKMASEAKEAVEQKLKLEEEARKARLLINEKTNYYNHLTHEFRTPLQVILGSAYEIERDAQNGLPGKVDNIKFQVKVLEDLVDRMLLLAKLEDGSMKLEMVQSDIVGYLEFITDSFSSIGFIRKINLSFHSQVEELLMDFSPQAVLETMSNLIGNALKFTPQFGKVVVSASAENGVLCISVKDNGMGIPNEELNNIFNRFTRVDNPGEVKGTGLGLAIAKSYVERLNGKVEVESTVGQGSEFKVLLPISNQANLVDKVDLSKPQPPIETSNLNDIQNSEIGTDQLPVLLIVEDSKLVRDYLRKLLSKNFKIFEAENGQQGVRLAKQYIPDLILTDEMMPVKSGFELLEEVKSDPNIKHIPVILLTAKGGAENELKGLGLQAEAYLTKPVEEQKLLLMVRNILSRNEHQKALLQQNHLWWDGKIVEVEFMKITLSILEEHYAEEDFNATRLKIQLTKKDRQLNDKTIERRIKKYFGEQITPLKLIELYRLDKAREILKSQPHISYKELSAQLGLSGKWSKSKFENKYTSNFGVEPFV